MADPELHRRLKDLHDELSTVGEVDADLERLLDDIRSDIEVVMEKSEPHAAFSDMLGQAVERFETSHPRLATAMGAVIDQLARMGI